MYSSNGQLMKARLILKISLSILFFRIGDFNFLSSLVSFNNSGLPHSLSFSPLASIINFVPDLLFVMADLTSIKTSSKNSFSSNIPQFISTSVSSPNLSIEVKLSFCPNIAAAYLPIPFLPWKFLPLGLDFSLYLLSVAGTSHLVKIVSLDIPCPSSNISIYRNELSL